MSTTSVTPWSMKVVIQDPTESAYVTLYKVSTTGSTCHASTDATPISCTLESLQGGTKYSVEAVACVSDSECSTPATTGGFTLPDRKYGR